MQHPSDHGKRHPGPQEARGDSAAPSEEDRKVSPVEIGDVGTHPGPNRHGVGAEAVECEDSTGAVEARGTNSVMMLEPTGAQSGHGGGQADVKCQWDT